MQIDKQNGNVAFSEASHTYWNLENPDAKYISVTTLIHSFTNPFDAQFWSAYKALEKLLPKDSWNVERKSLLNSKTFKKEILDVYNISEDDFNGVQQDILDDWAEENRKSCDRGTKIHATIENSFYGKEAKTLQKFGLGGKFECKQGYFDLDLENGIYPEYLIYRDSPDGVLHLAGQIDLLIKEGNDITIWDWKTNKKIETKSFFDSKSKSSVKMKYPLNNLDDANFYHYSLQLSTYAWMLQKLNPEFRIKGLNICHFDHDGNETVYKCDYLKTEVERMLCYYRKQILLEQSREKRKPIEY